MTGPVLTTRKNFAAERNCALSLCLKNSCFLLHQAEGPGVPEVAPALADDVVDAGRVPQVFERLAPAGHPARGGGSVVHRVVGDDDEIETRDPLAFFQGDGGFYRRIDLGDPQGDVGLDLALAAPLGLDDHELAPGCRHHSNGCSLLGSLVCRSYFQCRSAGTLPIPFLVAATFYLFLSQFPGAVLEAEHEFGWRSKNYSWFFKQREFNSGNW